VICIYHQQKLAGLETLGLFYAHRQRQTEKIINK